MPLLKINDGKLQKLHSFSVDLERDIQNLIEKNLPESLAMDFVASEFSITGGRIDSLAIDTNGSPVIIEYKKGNNSSIIAQIGFYYDWLQDHKETFEKLVQSKNIDRKIVWENPRLICIAESYNFYDYSAVKHFSVKVELLKYRFFENNLLYITPDRPIEIDEKLKRVSTAKNNSVSNTPTSIFLEDFLKSIQSKTQRKLLEDIRESILEISGDIHEKIFKSYISYRSTINFCDLQPLKNGSVAVQIPNNLLSEVALGSLKLKKGKSWSSLQISNNKNLEEIKNLIQIAYEESL